MCYGTHECNKSFEVELAIKTDENEIFIVLCYYL